LAECSESVSWSTIDSPDGDVEAEVDEEVVEADWTSPATPPIPGTTSEATEVEPEVEVEVELEVVDGVPPSGVVCPVPSAEVEGVTSWRLTVPGAGGGESGFWATAVRSPPAAEKRSSSWAAGW
jgi:hypothetical protein